ncbi:MAG: hypothetical protein ACRD5H_01975 [Nitrososphaerales archaeon]
MNIGLLLAINFISIPFISECEILGRETGRFPRLQDILKLAETRKKRWLKPYLVFLAIFFVIALFPTRSGKDYPASLKLLLSVAAIQIFLWAIAYLKIRQTKK